MSLNMLTISGNLGADAELRYTKSGLPVSSFSVAVNERVPNGDGTYGDRASWIGCTMFGKRAEALAPSLRKGERIALTGHLRQNVWEQDGKRRSSLEVVVDNVELMTVRRGKQQHSPEGVYDEDVPF